MTIKALFLPLILTTSLAFGSGLRYAHENELIFMFDHATEFSADVKNKMVDEVALWIKIVLDRHATGRLKLDKEDEEYIGRIAYLACGVMNARHSDELDDYFE